jgi:glycosyltransferase involved in cell wall biosynthesis
MSARRFYYRFKPYVPWSLRMGLRRMVASRQRKLHRGVWPISTAAGQAPDGWPGWPDAKRFAFVLTHDVEGAIGLGKCRQLMALEKRLGFRSSFNFVPEGDYSVPRELREELVRNGFEVGVHDLHHDGRLFQSRKAFVKSAVCINRYLREWGAAGFRGGFMMRELDWIHDLNIEYDASTFDTDPFEPQPEGSGTIFPFWIPRSEPQMSQIMNGKSSPASKAGYVELPYTLPQDSTLFFVLREKSPLIWQKKLDWIVERGGMALINVHPDYLGFEEGSRRVREFPVAWYENFLQSVKERYGEAMWQPLPGELARWYREKCLLKSAEVADAHPQRKDALTATRNGRIDLSGKKVGVILFSNYLTDARPRRSAEILAQHGAEVDVLSLRASDSEPRREVVSGVAIHRVPLKRRRGGKFSYLFQYFSFACAAMLFLSLRTFRRRYDLIHVHNMPDFLVFSALIPKIFGAKVILDLHDPMPELMLTIFKLPPESFSVRMLKRIEKWSTGFAHVVLTVNKASKRIFTSRSCRPEKVQVLMNSPNEQFFSFQPASSVSTNGKSAGRFSIMYHGSLLQRNGFDLAVEALEKVRKTIPGAALVVCGERTPFFDEVMADAERRGLQGAIDYLGMKGREEIVKIIDSCDLGIIPNHRSIFTEMNTPTRIFEYLSRGKPVISPRAPGILDYFGDADLVYFELGDAAGLAQKIEYVHAHPDEVRETVVRGQKVYLAHRWSQESLGFLDTVGRLVGRPN